MKNRNFNQTKAILAALLGNTIFGFSFLASKVALGFVEPFVLVAARFCIALAVLVVLVLLKIVQVDLKGKPIGKLILLGVFQPVLYFVFESYGIANTSSSISGAIIALIPIVSFFAGSLFLKEQFQTPQLLWAVISVLGVCILSVSGGGENMITIKGLCFLLGAVFSGAIFSVISRSLAEQFSPFERTFVMFFMGAVIFSSIALIKTRGECLNVLKNQMTNWTFLAALFYLAVLSSVVAFFMLNYAVSYLPVRQATSFTSITSVISVGAGVVFLHESLGIWQIAGVVLIIVGVYQVNCYQEK